MSTPTVALERRVTSNRVAKLRCSNCGRKFVPYPRSDAVPSVIVCKPCYQEGHLYHAHGDPCCGTCLAETWAWKLRTTLRAARLLVHKLRVAS
jgi:hypothetical protein